MPPKDSAYSEDWFRVARKDMDRAKRLLADRDLEGVAFHLQQAAEKTLKGFLLSKGWKLRRIHDLELLLNEAASFDGSIEPFRSQALRLTELYIEERYPGMTVSQVTELEISEAVRGVEDVMRRLIK